MLGKSLCTIISRYRFLLLIRLLPLLRYAPPPSLTNRLKKESTSRTDLEKHKRKVETELSDVKEQLSEKKLHLDELSKTIIKREDELTGALTKCDEEAVARAQVSRCAFRGLPDFRTVYMCVSACRLHDCVCALTCFCLCASVCACASVCINTCRYTSITAH